MQRLQTSALSIRAVTADDAAAIAAIYAPCVNGTIISFEEIAPDAAEMANRIASVTAHYPWLVACDGGEVVGYAYASKHRERAGYRTSVDVSAYVSEHARGHGIASQLYSALFDRLAGREFHRAFAGIALPNDASVALHRKFGFEPVGVYHEVGFKLGRWVDVAWFQRYVSSVLAIIP